MGEKQPFIKVLRGGRNFKMEDCEFRGDKPLIETDAINTQLSGVKHFVDTLMNDSNEKTVKIDWQKWGTIIALLALLVTIFFGIKGENSTNQKVSDSPNSINTIGQVGDNMIIGKLGRQLSENQKTILQNSLSKVPGKVAFISKIFDNEAKAYTDTISESFVSAGWNVNAKISQDLLDDFNGKINVFMTGTSSTSNLNIFLVEKIPAFDLAGIRYESTIPRVGSFGGNLEEDTLYIEVGSN